MTNDWGRVLYGTRDKRKLLRILRHDRPWLYWGWMTPEREAAIRFFPFNSRYSAQAAIDLIRSLLSHRRHQENAARRAARRGMSSERT